MIAFAKPSPPKPEPPPRSIVVRNEAGEITAAMGIDGPAGKPYCNLYRAARRGGISAEGIQQQLDKTPEGMAVANLDLVADIEKHTGRRLKEQGSFLDRYDKMVTASQPAEGWYDNANPLWMRAANRFHEERPDKYYLQQMYRKLGSLSEGPERDEYAKTVRYVETFVQTEDRIKVADKAQTQPGYPAYWESEEIGGYFKRTIDVLERIDSNLNKPTPAAIQTNARTSR